MPGSEICTKISAWARGWTAEESKLGEAGVFQMRGETVQDEAGEVQGLKHEPDILDNTEYIRQQRKD